MIKFHRPRFRRKLVRAFTLLELIVVLAIMGIVAALVVESGSRSLERSRIDAVAVELAGWLIAMHANNFSTNNMAAATPCYVDLASISNPAAVVTSAIPNDASYSIGNRLFVVRPQVVNGVQSANQSCSVPEPSFVLPDTAAGGYQIRAFSPIIFSVRGSVAIADNINGADDDSDIKIYRANSRLLRCVRIFYFTGTIRIGSNGNAASVADACNQFNTF